jgi:hypothetical protein
MTPVNITELRKRTTRTRAVWGKAREARAAANKACRDLEDQHRRLTAKTEQDEEAMEAALRALMDAVRAERIAYEAYDRATNDHWQAVRETNNGQNETLA